VHVAEPAALLPHPLTTRFLMPFAVFRHRPALSPNTQRSRSKLRRRAPGRECRTQTDFRKPPAAAGQFRGGS
jgi:hypothetical protein